MARYLYYKKTYWKRNLRGWNGSRTKEVNHLLQTRSLLIKKAVRQFIKENGKHITQVESTFYTLLEQKTRNMILKAIANNASRHRLSQYELLGNGNSNELR